MNLTRQTDKPASDRTLELEENEARRWLELAEQWDDRHAHNPDRRGRRCIRLPFLVGCPGPAARERLMMATARQMSDRSIRLLLREPLKPFQPVRVRCDLDAACPAWVRGVAVESVQGVGYYEVYVEYAFRRSA